MPRFTHLRSKLLNSAALAVGGLMLLSGCAMSARQTALIADPTPPLPTEQYPLQAQTQGRAVSLRIHPEGLSDNQQRALDQIAASASWIDGQPVNIQVVTGPAPVAIDAGWKVYNYLNAHHVAAANLALASAESQPADIVTINLTTYAARTYACNQGWENLTATGANRPYSNFGCAVTSNMAAMIADPRDLAHPQAPTPTDATRKSEILDKYRKGDVTSSAQDEQSKGNVSTAIQ